MDERLTGHAEPYRRNGRELRNRWRLVVNLPRVAVLAEDGQQTRTAAGRPVWRYPKRERLVSADGKRAANRELKRFVAEIEARFSHDGNGMTIRALSERWLETATIRPKTRRSYKNSLYHILPTLGEKLAGDLVASDLTNLYAAKRGTGLSETTCHHLHAAVDAMYSWARSDKLRL
jgi:hypothetical protein